MTPVRNLPLYPDKAAKPSRKRAPGTFGAIDNSVLAYQKKNGAADTRVLTALAERDNFTYKPSLMSVAELQLETELCERAVQKALKVLQAAGFCYREGKCWAYGNGPANSGANHEANREANGKANSRTVFFGSFAVQYEEIPVLKKLEDFRKIKTNNITCIDWPAQAPVVVGGTSVEKNLAAVTETAQGIAPDGAASGEAQQANLPHSQEKNMTDTPENEKHDTGFETVPPAQPAAALPQPDEAADPVPAAYAALEAAGLLDVWGKWFAALPALSRNRVALEAQICQFAEWAGAGFSVELRADVLDITSAGTFSHPFNTLKARMVKLAAVRQAEQCNAAEVCQVFGEAQCRPGERRREPATGKAWTVEEVAYGVVIFEEGDAPQNVADVTVATWWELA